MAESGLLDDQVDDAETLLKLLTRAETNGDAVHHRGGLRGPGEIVVRTVERKSGLARTHQVRRALLDAHEYRQLVRCTRELVAPAGTPPFTVSLGDDTPRR